MLMDRSAALAALSLKTEDVQLETGTLRVTELPAAEYMTLSDHPACQAKDGSVDGRAFMALMAVRCIVDESGQRLFTDDETDLLRQGSAAAYTRIVSAVRRVNGLEDNLEKN